MKRFNIEWKNAQYQAVEVTIFANTDKQLPILAASTEYCRALWREIECRGELMFEARKRDFDVDFYLTPDELALSDDELLQTIEANYYC
jgi:hypothetical protein